MLRYNNSKYGGRYTKHATEIMDAIFDFIKSYKNSHNGASPTVKEIGDAIGLNSVQPVYGYINRLRREGYISVQHVAQKPMIINIIDRHSNDIITEDDDNIYVPEHIARKIIDFIDNFKEYHGTIPPLHQIKSAFGIENEQIIEACIDCFKKNGKKDLQPNQYGDEKPYKNISDYEVWTSDDRYFKESDIVRNSVGELFVIVSISMPYYTGDDKTIVLKKLISRNPNVKYTLSLKDFKEKLSIEPDQKYEFEKVVSMSLK